MSVAKAIARAWTDAGYKARLLSEPHKALAECGVEVHGSTSVKVVEDTSKVLHLVLPPSPHGAGAMSLDQLEEIAAGTDPVTVNPMVTD